MLNAVYPPFAKIARTVENVEKAFKGIPFGDGWENYQRTPVDVETLTDKILEGKLLGPLRDGPRIHRGLGGGGIGGGGRNLQLLSLAKPLHFRLENVKAFVNGNRDTPQDRCTLAVMVDNEQFIDAVNLYTSKIKGELVQHAEEFFGRIRSPEQIEIMFKTPLTRNNVYDNSLMNIKVRLDAPKSSLGTRKVYDENTRRDITLEELRQGGISVKTLSIKGFVHGMWFSRNTCGLRIMAETVIRHTDRVNPSVYRAGVFIESTM